MLNARACSTRRCVQCCGPHLQDNLHHCPRVKGCQQDALHSLPDDLLILCFLACSVAMQCSAQCCMRTHTGGSPHLTCLASSHIARLGFEDHFHHSLLGVLFPGDCCAGSIHCRKNAAIALTPPRRANCPLKQASLAQQCPATDCYAQAMVVSGMSRQHCFTPPNLICVSVRPSARTAADSGLASAIVKLS